MTCLAQASAIDALKDKPEFRNIAFYRVDLDAQKEVVKALEVRLVLVAVVPFVLSIQEKLERSPLQMWEHNKMRVSLAAFWRLSGVGT